MPIIKRFAHCVVRINSKDHAPPHFHVVMNDGREAWVKIDPVEIIHGKVAAREIAEVVAWAASNRETLAAKFEELQQ
ncbi:MAG: DUF4160 domain-containing protein [Candidatus Competibacteraceae bacterium]|nr:MAG: DUF4160 domain-containing protein [Candidatus Competibacteraceae bacterium]